MSVPKQKRRKPNGSAADAGIVYNGESITATEAKLLKRKLLLEPLDLNSRLLLMGYYNSFRFSKRYLQERFIQVLWLIENRPADFFTSIARATSNGRNWSPEMTQVALDCWKKQAKKHPKDARILFNAGIQFEEVEPTRTIALWKKSSKADSNFAPPVRDLANFYRRKARTGIVSEKKRLVRLALDTLDLALTLRHNDDFAFDEPITMLIEFTPVAITYGYLDRARQYATRLRRYKAHLLCRQFAETYLLRLDVIEGKYKSAEKRIARLKQLYSEHPSHVTANTQALLTLADLCQHDQCNLAQLLLDAIRRGTDDKAELKILSRWSNEIARKLIPNFQVDSN
ncbi:hypothetical protein KBI23_25965 [bacterium]|nr:hypothetical protein [bacterium]MBP9807845.1 hypothetical protein [bacterium]